MRVVAYISGHGYGHSTRLVALLEALRARLGPFDLALRTQVPAWLFEVALQPPYRHQPTQVDAGMAEHGLLHMDSSGTLARCRQFYDRFDQVLSGEVAALAAAPPDLILSDIPPLAAAVGRALEVPNAALGNFSWDFIYAALTPHEPGFAAIAEQCRQLYADTSLLLRLPFCHEMTAFPTQVDVPLIARWPQQPPAVTRAALGLDPADPRPVVLIVSRHQPEGDQMLANLAATGRFRVLRFGPETREPGANQWQLGPEWQHRFVDVLAACDAVVSKLGYGLVSECLTARTAILYPPRYDWAEQPYLAAGLEGTLPHLALSEADFIAGRLAEPLTVLLTQPDDYAPPPTTGPAQAAEAVARLVGG